MRLCITRWLAAPFSGRDGNETLRTAGTLRGGVISPVGNVFTRHASGLWMLREHPEAFKQCLADDAIIHCRTRAEAETLKIQPKARSATCKPEVNEEKVRTACCRDSSRTEDEPIPKFTFLGCTFSEVRVPGRRGWFWSFQPRASM